MPASKLDVIGQASIADLYRAMLAVSPSLIPPVVDQLELWQCASLLGVEGSMGARGRDYTAERAAAIRDGRPLPRPEPVDLAALGIPRD